MVSQWSVGNKIVQSLMIGNKEVQSIVRVSDNAVLYEKAASHSYALAFSSASYQTDSSGDVTVSCTLTDNGVAVSGETVSFSDGTSVYTGITNNLGVASCNLNYHSNGSVTASYSNITATASIVSNYVPRISTHFYWDFEDEWMYLYDVDDNPMKQVTVLKYNPNGTLVMALTTTRKGQIIQYDSSDIRNGVYLVFEGNDTYEGCTYP